MREELEKKVQRAIKLIQSASKIAAENGCLEIEVAYFATFVPIKQKSG